MNIHELYEIYCQHPIVSTDTRNIAKNAIYFALKGSSFDGNDFVQQALNQGAAYCVIDNPNAFAGRQTILVENALETLQQLANFHRKQLNIPVIAITGTNGKTTTKELTYAILSTVFRASCTKGNLNNHIGVPLTLLSIQKNCEIAVIEMGANHLREIDALCNIAEPNFGLITNIGKAHLKGFGSPEGVVQAKTELYRFIESKNGTLFVNGDDELLMNHSKKSTRITYGKANSCATKGSIEKMNPFLNVTFSTDNQIFSSKTNLIFDYNLYNILAAVCIGSYFKVPVEKIVYALEKYVPDNMRSQVLYEGSNTIILDAYNANPTSMEVTLNNFFQFEAEQKIAILGDMLELGDWSDDAHEAIVRKLINSDIKTALFVGGHFSKIRLPAQFLHFSDVDMLGDYLKTHRFENSLILIKGSRGIKLEKAVNYLKA